MAIELGYPKPRQRGASAPIVATAPIPNVRLWPFHARNSAGVGRSTNVSPFFQGPAIVERILIRHASGGLVPDPQISLVYSAENGGEGFNFAGNTLPSGTPIFDNLTRTADESGGSNSVGPGVLLVAHTPDGLLHEWTTGYIIRLPRFTLKVSVHVTNAGSDVSCFGYIRIIENVSPETLANFT